MGVGVTHTPGSHSQREKVAVWPSFRLSGCSKQKVSTGRQGLDRCPRRQEQGRQAASARPRAPRPAVSAENLTTLWVSAVAICTLHLDFCQVRMVCHPWRAPHPTQCWLQGHSPGSKVPVTGRRSGGRGAPCSRARGAVRSRDVWGLLSANTTYFPRLRGLVASRRGTSGTFPRDFLPPV